MLVIGRVQWKPLEQQDWLILAQGAQIHSLFFGVVPLTVKVSCNSHMFSTCHPEQAALRQGWALQL